MHVSLLTGLIIISDVLIYGLVNTLIVYMFGSPICMLDCCICLTKMSEPKLANCACVLRAGCMMPDWHDHIAFLFIGYICTCVQVDNVCCVCKVVLTFC